MAVKTLNQQKARKQAIALSYSRRLRTLIEEQKGLSARLTRLLEDLEDEEDHLAIERAKKRDAGKPGIPWAEAKKRLGLD